MCTTPGQSSFQNGLRERMHAATDTMLLRLVEQTPEVSVNMLLCWANLHGVKLPTNVAWHQMVFEKNPGLPSIVIDGRPALDEATTSEILAKHLNALRSARKTFIESDADERIRRALRRKMRASEKVFNHAWWSSLL